MSERNTLSGLFVPNDEQRARLEKMSICILAPAADYKSSVSWLKCMGNALAYSWANGLKIYEIRMTERMVVQWARNYLARMFMEHPCPYTGEPYTHALWLDDDHVFNADMFVRLAAWGHLDMISAVYYSRVSPYYPTVYIKDDTEKKYSCWPMMELPPAVVQVDAVGFGALLMKREVLEGTPEPWFTIDSDGGEDMAFCFRAKAAGFKVWADGAYQIGHIGPPELVTRVHSQKHMEEHPEKYTSRVMFELKTPHTGAL